MDDGKYLLYWRDQLVGVVTDVSWADFPWAGGTIAVSPLTDELRAVLEHIDRQSSTDEGLRDWPFPDELAEDWRIVKPDGKDIEITPPVIDFAEGYVTWR